MGEKRWSGAERGAGGRRAGTERGAEVTGLSWIAERLFRPLRSHALAAACKFVTRQSKTTTIAPIGYFTITENDCKR